MTSRKPKEQKWDDAPFLTEKGIELIKRYQTPRTNLGMGRYGAYQDYGEDIYRVGYGSKRMGKYWIKRNDKFSTKEIDRQLVVDLKELSNQIAAYVFVPLNSNRKAALLSFAFDVGVCGFKNSRLLELINSLAPKNKIIREWSPYINCIWLSGGDQVIKRRRVEIDTYYTPDDEIPTLIQHKCEVKRCLLNLVETYNGSPSQIKAVEYLERKLNQWDPSGRAMRHFFDYWNEKPTGLAYLPLLDQNL